MHDRPAPGHPCDMPDTSVDEIRRRSMRQERTAERVASFVLGHGFSRHDCQSVLRLAGAKIDMFHNFNPNSHEGQTPSKGD